MRTASVVRGLIGPAYGVVKELGSVSQCCCSGAVHIQQPWNTTSSSSSSSSTGTFSQQHPLQLQQQRHKHTVRVVLLRDHKHLGKQGDIVEVKAGHARSSLFPNGEADYAVPSVIKQLQASGVLSEEALKKLQRGGSRKAAAAHTTDPSTLPPQQQLQQAIKLLAQRQLVVSRRFSLTQPDQPMVGPVTARQLRLYVAKQLQLDLPRELILMEDSSPITQFGSYKVPLNLKGQDGRQVELAVQVNKTYRAPGLRRLKLWGQQQGLIQAPAAAAADHQQQQQQQSPPTGGEPGQGEQQAQSEQQQQQQQQPPSA